MRDGAGTIRRVIDDTAWDEQVIAKLDRGMTVTAWKGDQALVLRKTGADLEAKQAKQEKFAKIGPTVIANIKANCTLGPPAHLGEAATFEKKVNPGKGFEVTEFENEPLSLVHHTASTGEEKNPHLTVENAHVLAAEDILNPTSKTRDVRSKSGEDKSTINDKLTAEYGVGSVDNLNFYQPEKAKGGQGGKGQKGGKGGAKTAHEELPLSGYLAFLAHALTVGGAPPEYGEKMITLANKMAEDQHLDTSQLFLRAGMDEPAFVRAVFIIDSQLPADSKLAIEAPVRHVFEKWWYVDDNDPKVPFLPAPEALDGPAIVRSGTQYEQTTFSKLEIQYSQKYFGDLVTAINAFTPAPQVVEVVADKKKGGKTKK